MWGIDGFITGEKNFVSLYKFAMLTAELKVVCAPSLVARAVWVDLTGDGRMSILTARAKLGRVGGASGDNAAATRPKNGQLVWLEMPQPHKFDEATGTPLEEDGTTFDPFSSRHLPWTER